MKDCPSASSVRENRIVLWGAVAMLALAVSARTITAAPPAGFYDSVDTTTAATLRNSLHAIIDDHTRFPYTSGSTDTWDILEAAQQDPANSGNIIDVYRNRSHTKIGGGVGPYNREHSWPKSYGFPNDNADNYPYTDCYQLFLCDSGYNSSRSNKPFRDCDAGCSEQTTDANNGQGGGAGTYPGNSNWTSGSFTQGTWEVWRGRRGDIARAQFYLDVRYEGGTHGITGSAEPDLILTDNEALIDASNTGSNESIAYMGMLPELLQWHLEDPVDDWERNRNDVVFGYQGNRNPFIDHPEWVACLFANNCNGGGGGPPSAPSSLSAVAGDGIVSLDWADNPEPDLNGYSVYRSTVSGGPFSLISGALLTSSDYIDTSVNNGTTYDYVVTATNSNTEESADSNEVSATPNPIVGNPPGLPWINEFHYDNNGGDTGEFVEIAGGAGTDLAGWIVYGYNGNGGVVYDQIALSGVIPDQGGCMGTLSFAFNGMQNGAPDGLALVDPLDNVIQFISYEGVLIANNGPASGMSSTDIGVSEQPAPAVGQSLQLSGTGSQYDDFTWVSPSFNTEGDPNTNQVFDGCSSDTMPPAAPVMLVANGGVSQIALDWNDTIEGDLAGYNVYRSTSAGGPYTQINGPLIIPSDYTDASALNCTTYFYVVSAADDSGNESGISNEAFDTPSSSGAAAEDCDSNGVPDDCQSDGDNDGVIDACDGCPTDPDKQSPDVCGCGVSDFDSDNDGTPDCNDLCPLDPDKQSPGNCGCGIADIADGDLNDDGNVDGLDLQRFVSALTSVAPTSADLCHGDFDDSNDLDESDIAGFIAALLSQ